MDHAVVFTEPQQAVYIPIAPSDEPLAPDEVSGSTVVTLVSPGTELALYKDGSFPYQPGYAAIFKIDALGSNVDQLQVDDLVFCMGQHRSFQRLSATKVVRLPDTLTPETAVFARMMCISMSTLATTVARPPAKVLVNGLGVVGHLAAQIFDHCGYDVLACDGDAARRSLLNARGIATVADVPLEDARVAGQVALALECTGNETAVHDVCNIVRKRGEVVLIGVPWRQRTTLSAHTLLHTVFHRYVVLRSGWEWELPLQTADFQTNSIFGNVATALAWLAAGDVHVDGLATTAAPHAAQDVYQRLLQRKSTTLATIFDWTTSM